MSNIIEKKKNRNKQQRTIESVVFLSLFFGLLNVSSIYSYYFPFFSNLTIFLSAFFCLVGMLLAPRKIIYSQVVAISSIWLLAVTISSLFNTLSVSLINYIIKFIVVSINLAILRTIHGSVFNILLKCCKIFVVWSFVNLFFSYVSPAFLPITASYLTEWGGHYYLYFFFIFPNTSGITVLNQLFIRMHSPFSEPGNAQMFYNLGLFIVLFKRKKLEKKWMLLFVLSVILSISLTGYAIMFFLIYFYLLIKKRLLMACVLISPVIVVSLVLITNKMSSVSYFDRLNDLLYVFSSAKDNFPFGIGIGNENDAGIRVLWDGSVVQGGFFSGLFTPLLYLGFFSIVFYFLLVLSIRFNDEKNKKTILPFSIYLLISLFTEPQCFSVLLMIFFVNGLFNWLYHSKISVRTSRLSIE